MSRAHLIEQGKAPCHLCGHIAADQDEHDAHYLDTHYTT